MSLTIASVNVNGIRAATKIRNENNPGMLAWLSAQGTLPIDTHIHAKKGSVWVLSFRDGQLTGADYVPSALPVL